MASTAISSPEYVAKDLADKLYGESIPTPTKYLNIIEMCDIEWCRSEYRFKNLIFTYCIFYRDMLNNIQKQQNILQVNECAKIFYF